MLFVNRTMLAGCAHCEIIGVVEGLLRKLLDQSQESYFVLESKQDWGRDDTTSYRKNIFSGRVIHELYMNICSTQTKFKLCMCRI